MNPQSTSFIPKRPVTGNTQKRVVRKIYVLTYVSYILFFGTLLAVAGVFFFKLTLESQLVGQQQQLITEKAQFSQSDIESVRELADRIDLAKDRMDQHISVLSILEALDKSALETLQFTDFTYERSLDTAPIVKLKGNTASFNSLVFQREVLSENPILASGTFDEVAFDLESEEENVQNERTITFELNTEIDPALVKYVPRVNVLNMEETEAFEASEDFGAIEEVEGTLDSEF